MIETFPSEIKTAQQALIEADRDVEDMEMVAIIYQKKGCDMPYLTCSSMTPKDLSFFGHALTDFAIRSME